MARRGAWRTFAEDSWNWDLSGFVHTPSVLTEAELREAREAAAVPGPLTQVGALTEHATLRSFLRRLCGEAAPLHGHANGEERIAYRLDRPASLLLRADFQQSSLGDRHRLRYDTTARPDMVVVKGVRALWVLDDTTEVVIVPASHKASLPPPSLARMEELDTISRPVLRPGDLLLLAATTLFGLRPPQHTAPVAEAPRVVELMFADKQLAAPEQGYVERPLAEMPGWMNQLTDAQLAVIRPGVMGVPSASLTTDGTTVRTVNPAADTDLAVANIAAEAWLQDREQHSAEEMWQWDAQGYCIARGVMDEQWLSAANAALDAYRSDPAIVHEIGDSELWQEPDCSDTLRPIGYSSGEYQNEERMSGLEGLPSPFGEPFRRMIAHPAGRET